MEHQWKPSFTKIGSHQGGLAELLPLDGEDAGVVEGGVFIGTCLMYSS